MRQSGRRYFISLYWSMTTFSTNGYGDFTSQNEAEVVWSICYMMWNLGLSAYILGTSLAVSSLSWSFSWASLCASAIKFIDALCVSALLFVEGR